ECSLMEAMRPVAEATSSQSTAQPMNTKVTRRLESSTSARAASSRASSPLARAPGNAACKALRASGLAAGSSVVPISLAPKITRAPLASESNQPRIIATMKNARAMVEMRYADNSVVVAMRLMLLGLNARESFRRRVVAAITGMARHKSHDTANDTVGHRRAV